VIVDCVQGLPDDLEIALPIRNLHESEGMISMNDHLIAPVLQEQDPSLQYQ
jgi:hypothetical protein